MKWITSDIKKPLYTIVLWEDVDGVLNFEETSNLTRPNQLASYNPLSKTLYSNTSDQLFNLGRKLANSPLLDIKDKGLFACLCYGYYEEVLKLNNKYTKKRK